MTPDEHKLMVAVFTRQTMLIRALADALISHGVLQKDDVPAYGALLDSKPSELTQVTEGTLNLYRDIARTLKLETGL